MDGKIWYRAAIFPSLAKASEAWREVHNTSVVRRGVDLTEITVKWHGVPFLIVFNPYGEEPPKEVQGKIEQILAKGKASEVPETLLYNMWKRRMGREMRHFISGEQPDEHGNWYESHERKRLQMDRAEYLTFEYKRKFAQAVIDDRLPYGYPLWEIYKEVVDINLRGSAAAYSLDEEDLETLVDRFARDVDQAEKFLLTPSARAMYNAVHEENSEFIEFRPELWIQFDELAEIHPELNIPDRAVQAVFLHSTSAPVRDTIDLARSMGVDHLPRQLVHLSVLDQQMIPVIDTLIDPDDETTDILLMDYDCPWNACTFKTVNDIRVMRNPCPGCLKIRDHWIDWLHTMTRILRQDFAVTADPEPYKQREVEFKQQKLMPRHHGKGDPKLKTFVIKAPVTMVSFDVSTHRPSRQEVDEIEHEAGGRVNWFYMYGRESMLWEHRNIKDTVRRYTGEHYRALIARVIQDPGYKSSEGEEYKLRQLPDGSYQVIGRLKYPKGKWVPMLKPEAKGQKVKKVRAKLYEDQA